MAEPQLTRDAVVSFDSDTLILVDELDREIGQASKARCHEGEGMLHRAFSLFVFNPHGELLLQQRARGKRLWPGYWSNSCCSHPRHGEAMTDAVQRRLREELGIDCALRFVYKFRYRAIFGSLGTEHELCWVYTGVTGGPVRSNANEIAAHRWVAPAELDREIAAAPERFTPWMGMEWRRLRDEFSQLLPRPADTRADPGPKRDGGR